MGKKKFVRQARWPQSVYNTDLGKAITPFAKRAEELKKKERSKKQNG